MNLTSHLYRHPCRADVQPVHEALLSESPYACRQNRTVADKHTHLTRCVALFLFCVLFFSIFSLQPALDSAEAAAWPLAQSRLSSSLAFHATYTAGGKEYVHSGMDIAATAGSTIKAPVSGKVSFVGAVPSGDSLVTGGGAGQTMDAVSIKMSDGRTVTLMPFQSTSVTKGTKVSEGSKLGSLAASGDRSSSAPHLHMGLKKGSTYYDPMSLFGLAASDTNTAAQTAGSVALLSTPAASATAGEAAEGAGASEVTTTEQVTETSSVSDVTLSSEVSAQEASSPAGEPTGEASEQSLVGDSVSSGDVVWTPQDDEATAASPLAWAGAALAGLYSACIAQASAFFAALEDLAVQMGVSVVAICAFLLASGIAVLAALAFCFIHWGVPLIKRTAARVRKGAATTLVQTGGG